MPTSDCCGAEAGAIFQDVERCPVCGESCGFTTYCECCGDFCEPMEEEGKCDACEGGKHRPTSEVSNG